MKLQVPNHSQIPNSVIDSMAELSDPELRVVLTICRQTFGWHRDKASLSIGFLEKATGLSRQSIINASKSLVLKMIIEKESSSEHNGSNVFKLVVHELDQSTPLAPHSLIGRPQEPTPLAPPSLIGGLGGAYELDPKKETVKESTKRKGVALMPEIPSSLKTPEFQKAWGEWLQDRKQRSKPVTPLAAEKQFRDMERWGAEKSIRAIDEAIKKGWQGLFEPKGVPTQRNFTNLEANPFANITQ